jgi:CRISPR-associated protein Csb2
MLVIEFGFPAGRFHATPWGHNVNEGLVEWPPSPYRLARALVDAGRRRRPDWDDERLTAVIGALERPIGFQLPPATASHTRVYLNSNEKDPTKKQKVFDSFVVIDRSERLLASFDAELCGNLREDLDSLLAELNYFGRSESWVSARLIDDEGVELDCLPARSTEGLHEHDVVNVACLRTSDEYEALEQKPIAGRAKKGKNAHELSWIEALSMSTDDLLRQGWSEPPSQKTVPYLRPSDALRPRPRRQRRALSSRFTTATYALHSTVLPRVTETVPFAEKIHRKLMGIHKRIQGGDPTAVSPLFSGKDEYGKPARGHEHSQILPTDEDDDGRIDHLLIRAGRHYNSSELEALDRLRSIWQSDGRPDANLVLTSLGSSNSAIAARTWVSATPFVTRRHHRRGRGEFFDWLTSEVRRECGFHKLPEPEEIEWIDHTQTSGHSIRWMEFIRSHKGERPLRGHGAVITFANPICGPVAIGALCHFGLGQFVPIGDDITHRG